MKTSLFELMRTAEDMMYLLYLEKGRNKPTKITKKNIDHCFDCVF